MKSLLFLMALVAGVATSAQAVINSQLRGRLAEPMQAATISFTVGTLICFAYCFLSRIPFPAIETLKGLPWWMWTGGALGTLFVWTSILVTRQIGVAAMIGLVVAGQMIASLVIDHYGLFHSQVRLASPGRVLGAGLVILGVALMTSSMDRKPSSNVPTSETPAEIK